MKKKLFLVFIAVCFALTVCMMCGQALAAEVVTLKAVTAWPKTSSENKAFFIFTELV